MLGNLHPVVDGNEIGKFKKDLIARYAKACDSTKSPWILSSSINLILLLIFFSILSIKNLFFLPPPHAYIFFPSIFFDKISEVYSVNVAAPSLNERPFIKDMSIEGKISSHGRDKKIIVFKMKRRKRYRRKHGHRQDFSMIKFDKIESKKKKAATKKTTTTKTTAKKTTATKAKAATKKTTAKAATKKKD